MEDEEERRSKGEREKGRGKEGRYILLRQDKYTRTVIKNTVEAVHESHTASRRGVLLMCSR